MTLYFNEGRYGKPNTLRGSLENANTRLEFDELRLKKRSDGFDLVGHFTGGTDIKNYGGSSDWEFKDIIASITLHNQNYEKNVKNGEDFKKIEVAPTSLEMFLCERFEEDSELWQPDDKALKGFIYLWDSEKSVCQARFGKDPFSNKELSSENVNFIRSQFYDIEHTEINKITDDLLDSTQKKGYGKRSYGQSEYERLNDRFKWLLEKTHPYTGGQEMTNLAEIMLIFESMKRENPDVYQDVMKFFS